MTYVAPGWYPDPQDGRYHRWWDGYQWTEHTNAPGQEAPRPEVAPAATTPTGSGSEGRKPRKRVKAVVLSLVGAATAAALAVGGIAVVSALNGSAGEYEVAGGYAWAPITYLDTDEDFSIPMSVDPEEIAQDLGNEGYDLTGVIDVFVDQEFTSTLRFSSAYWIESEKKVELRALDTTEMYWDMDAPDGNGYPLTIRETTDERQTSWTDVDRYYVVQHYDADGEKLKHPIVHTISSSSEELIDPIVPTVSPGDIPGSVKISWDEPANMPDSASYLIVKTKADYSDVSSTEVTYEIVAKTTETSWQSVTSAEEADRGLNAELNLFGGDSVDEANYMGDGHIQVGGTMSKIAIMAVKGTAQHSPMVFTEVASKIGTYPMQMAFWQQRTLFPVDVGDLTTIPVWFPVVTLNGNTTKMPIRIDPESVEVKYEDYWYLDGRGEYYSSMRVIIPGTTLTTTLTAVKPFGMSDADWHAATVANIDAFNTRALAETPKLGDRFLTADDTLSADRFEKMDIASGDPETSYDVFGSNEFTRYIAGHMLNGAGSIDVSSFLDDPSMPSLDDAAQEAVKQNPMLSLAVESYVPEDDRLYVVYREDHETTEAVRSEILDIAESVVGEITTADMGDAEKATAINQWIVDNIEYDYEALDALQASGGYAPPGYEMREWDTRGALLDKMVVCGGYADAFNLLAREAGLESVYVSGDVSSGAHAWNHVKIDGEWKAIDTTWNDNGIDPTLYLLIDESDFTGDAQRTLAESGWIASIHQDEYATP